MNARTKAAAILGSAVACGVAVGAGLALSENREPWPPEWYVEATRNQETHLALWRRYRRPAVRSQDRRFPPNAPKLDLLVLYAVGASSEPGDSRPTDARVYFSDPISANSLIGGGSTVTGDGSSYVLALRGKFSTARIRTPPPGPRSRYRLPKFQPMVVLVIDAATMDSTATYIGPVRDLSLLGESIELDLDQELF